MQRIILAAVAAAALALAIPAGASAQNCNVGGCNMVVTSVGSGTWATVNSPVVFYPWTVDAADGSLNGSYFWSSDNFPPGQFSKEFVNVGGANDYLCHAATAFATTTFRLSVKAPAGRKFSCHFHVTP